MPENRTSVKNVLSRMIRIGFGRISRKDLLTYLFFVLLAAVFWVGVTLHDQDIAIEQMLKQITEMQIQGGAH